MVNSQSYFCRKIFNVKVKEDRLDVLRPLSRHISVIIITIFAGMAHADHGLSAISGDKIRVYDGQISLQGVRCPDPDSEAGKIAQRLANVYLHGAHVYCELIRREGNGAIGDCKLRSNNGNTLSEMLVASGYCEKIEIETNCNTTTRLLFECGT